MPLILDLPFASLVSVISTIVMVLFILSAFLLTVVILLQEGKGGGLSGAFGGAGTDAFGVKSGTVNKFTAWLGGLFLGLALLHAGLVSAGGTLKLDEKSPAPSTEKFSPGEESGAASGDEASGDEEGAEKPGDSDGAPKKDPAPDPDAPKPDAPKPDAPKPDAPKPDAPEPDAPEPDAPKPDDK